MGLRLACPFLVAFANLPCPKKQRGLGIHCRGANPDPGISGSTRA